MWLSCLLTVGTCIFLVLLIITPHLPPPRRRHLCALLNGKKVNFFQKMLWSPVPLRGLGLRKSLRASFWTVFRVILFSCSLPTCPVLKPLAQVSVCHSMAYGNKLYSPDDFSDNYCFPPLFYFPFHADFMFLLFFPFWQLCFAARLH